MAPVHQPIIVNCFKHSLDVGALYLWHFKPVIGDSAVCCSLSSHIFVSPPTSHRPDGTNLTAWWTETLGVSSLSKAISQKPSSRASNSQPSDHKSGTLTTRPSSSLSSSSSSSSSSPSPSSSSSSPICRDLLWMNACWSINRWVNE